MTSTSYRNLIDRPIIIVSTPRSGSTLLFETLERAPGLFTTGRESHRLIEQIPGLAPSQRDWSSNRLKAEDAIPETAEQLSRLFYENVTDRDGLRPKARARIMEKTPKNALRVPFFRTVWPDASFLYLYRDPRETLYSMMEAWHSGAFRTYPSLPAWTGPPWSMLLVPGWQRLDGLPLQQLVAHQWAITTNILIDDLEAIPEGRVGALSYRDFVANPRQWAEAVASSVKLEWDVELGGELRLSKTVVSRPDPDKWRRLAPVIESVWPIVAEADGRAQEFLRRHRLR